MLAELWSDLRYRLRAIFRRGDVERELADELRAHLERETEKLVQAGVSPSEAHRRARTAFGGVERIKDDTRDARGVAFFDMATQEIRYAARALRMRPGFAAAVVATLALGIGANAAMFGVVDRLMFRPAPFLRDPASVSRVYTSSIFQHSDIINDHLEFRRYRELADWSSSFSDVAGFQVYETGVGSGDSSRELTIGTASATFFDFFDVRPVVGRFYASDEDRVPGGARVAVLGYDFWQVEYGGRRDVIGTTLQIGPAMFTVIGVAPKGFLGLATGAPPVAWIPLTTRAALNSPDFYTNYNWGWLEMIGRRKPGVSETAATADITAAYRRTWLSERSIDPSQEPIDVAKPHVILAPTQVDRGPRAGPEARAILLVTGVAFIVLLVACANVANLLLARGFARRRELAVRLAMGVSRARLLGHLIAESMLLAIGGTVAGLILARLAGGGLNATFDIDGGLHPSLFDTRTLLYSGTIAILVGIVTGLVPALHAGRTDVLTDLRSGARDGGFRRSRTRAVLVVLQGALSVILLIGAGLFVRSLINVRSMRLGYDADRVLLVGRNMRGIKTTPDEARALLRQLIGAATVLPGVENASEATSAPFIDYESTRLVVPGIDSMDRLGRFQLQFASPTYFATMGTRIVAGRGITVEDRRDAPRVIVVSETMARRLWPGRNALGQCIHVGADTVPCSTVVGVAEDIKERSMSHEGAANYYLAAAQMQRAASFVFVRMRGRGSDGAEEVRRALQRVMPGGSYVTVTPFAEIVGEQQQSWRLGATMFVAFGVLALGIGAIGLYSVIAFGVEQRSRELSIRLALGAQARGVMRLVIGEGMRLAAVGIVVGGAFALFGGRWISTLLFDESPRDPVIYAVVTGVLFVVAVAASAIPAFRATRLDPNVALRAD